jgi:hypothetical protein
VLAQIAFDQFLTGPQISVHNVGPKLADAIVDDGPGLSARAGAGLCHENSGHCRRIFGRDRAAGPLAYGRDHHVWLLLRRNLPCNFYSLFRLIGAFFTTAQLAAWGVGGVDFVRQYC